MLNDLLAIERRLAAHGIVVAGRHPDVKDMAKGPAFRVRLAVDGSIHKVDLDPDAGHGSLWTLRDGQHNGFPGLKTAAGLVSLDSAARDAHNRAWQSDKIAPARRRELQRIAGISAFDAARHLAWPGVKHRSRIAERLQALRTLASDPLTAAVPAAFERFLLATETPQTFLESLRAHLVDAVLDRDDDWLEAIREAFVGGTALFIDVPDAERDAGDPRQIGPVSAALSGGTAPIMVDGSAVCALTGDRAALHSGNFPQPNLPGLGQTYLFARNKDIPSLARYGRSADASLPVSSDLVRRLSGTIAALTGADQKGRSWRLIPGETGDKPDLLVTSATERLADALAGEDDDERVDGWALWDEYGARVLCQTHGQDAGVAPLEEVVILILRTVDPANRKAIYQRKTTSIEIWNAAVRWREATNNLPDWLGFPMPVKGEKEGRFRSPPFVDPLSITKLSRTLFANGGRRRVPVIGVSAADAFGLFLHEGDAKRRARRILRVLLQRHGPLLAGLTAARGKSFDDLKAFDPKADLRRDALRSLTWLGALLYTLGCKSKRDATMPEQVPFPEDLAFRLGQFLSAADNIHVGYCADMRGGDVPPSLIGNSVFAIAGSDPFRALSILQTRLKPYLGWAKRVREDRTKSAALTKGAKEGNSRALSMRKATFQAQDANESAAKLCLELSAFKEGSAPPDDLFRAKLLLGYMAGYPRPPKKVQASGAPEINSNGENGGNAT